MTTDAHEDLDPVRVAREAVAKETAPEATRQSKAMARIWAEVGARAMKAACEAAGAKPAAWVWPEDIRSIAAGHERVSLWAVEVPGMAPLYAHPPAVAAGRVKVKALEWCDLPNWTKKAGDYFIEDQGSNWSDDRYHLFFYGRNAANRLGRFATPEAASDAANQHNEQRILSALEGGGAQEDGEYRWVRFRQVESAPLVIEDDDVVPSGAGLDLEDGRFSKLSNDPPAALPEGFSAPLDFKTTYERVAEREAVPTPAPGQHAGLVERLRDADGIAGVLNGEATVLEDAALVITALEADNKAKDARIAELEREIDEYRRAIMEGEPSPALKMGNFLEMVRSLHAAQKGGLARATAAEAELAALRDEVERLRSRTLTVFDWAYTDPETGREVYARTPFRAEALTKAGIKLTPVYTIDDAALATAKEG